MLSSTSKTVSAVIHHHCAPSNRWRVDATLISSTHKPYSVFSRSLYLSCLLIPLIAFPPHLPPLHSRSTHLFPRIKPSNSFPSTFFFFFFICFPPSLPGCLFHTWSPRRNSHVSSGEMPSHNRIGSLSFLSFSLHFMNTFPLSLSSFLPSLTPSPWLSPSSRCLCLSLLPPPPFLTPPSFLVLSPLYPALYRLQIQKEPINLGASYTAQHVRIETLKAPSLSEGHVNIMKT